MLRRENRDRILALNVLAGQDVDDVDRFDAIAEEFDAVHELFIYADELQRVAAHAERPAHEVEIVAAVLHIDQPPQQNVAVDVGAHTERLRELHIVGGRAQAVDARDRSHDERVGPRQQRLRGGMAQAFDLVVDRTVLFDIGVGVRDIRFGLIVIEVRDEKLDGVFGEKFAELGA